MFEKFLTSKATARYLCGQLGLADLANDLVPVISDLQDAHERLVTREANRVLIKMVKSIRAKAVSVDQAQELFELDGTALDALLNHLDSPPVQDLASYLSTAKHSTKTKRTLNGIKWVSVRELHNKTAAVVRSVASHGEILVIERGRIIVKIVSKHDPARVPYFARREPSPAFAKLDSTGETGGGTDITKSISEDRDERP